jgi:hypothetical protein
MQIPSCILGITLHKKCKHAFYTVFADKILNKKFILNATAPKIPANISGPSNNATSSAIFIALYLLHVALLGVGMIVFLSL